MDKCRVNRIAVKIDKKTDDTTISLYKTNTLLATIDADDLDIDSFQKSGVSAKAYQAYCRDIIINLLDNGGIEGYYYDPKEEKTGVKYDRSGMVTACMEYVTNVIGDRYNYKHTLNNEVLEMEQYGDKFIKNAKMLVEVLIESYDLKIQVVAEIRSGQMCRPKSFIYNDDEYQFNITTINKLIKSL